jgi:RNA polymerase sigma-70 factor (ECF subfamily)
MARELTYQVHHDSYARPGAGQMPVMTEWSPPAPDGLAVRRRDAEDAEIEALLARGDRKAALGALMDAHGEAVYGFCVRIVRDRSLAEDVLQRVFLDACRGVDRFSGQSSLVAWLIGIASHRCLDALRSQRRHAQRVTSDEQAVVGFADPGATPTDQLERTRIVAALDDCLQHLSDDVRLTVLLRFQHGTSYGEMSSRLGASINTLQARVSRALPVLRRCLEGKGWGDA